MPATRVYARWSGQLQLSLPDHLQVVPAHTYDAPIPMPACPRRGERVQVIALSPMVYRTMHTPIGTRQYDVYDPYIEGVVVGVMMVGKVQVVFAVKNERLEAGVQWVVVTAPYDREMMDPPVEDCPLGWLREVLSKGRSNVSLQRDAVVVDELGNDPSPPVSLQYPDPRVWRRDQMLMDRCGAWRPEKPKPVVSEMM